MIQVRYAPGTFNFRYLNGLQRYAECSDRRSRSSGGRPRHRSGAKALRSDATGDRDGRRCKRALSTKLDALLGHPAQQRRAPSRAARYRDSAARDAHATRRWSVAAGAQPDAPRSSSAGSSRRRQRSSSSRRRRVVRRGRIRLSSDVARRRLTAIVWRHVSPQRHLLDLLDPAPYPGRYHRQSDPGTWYSSLTEHGAWAEHIRHHPAGGVSPLEVRRRIGRARAADLVVLDLTDAKVRKQLGVRKEDLTGEDWTICQRL